MVCASLRLISDTCGFFFYSTGALLALIYVFYTFPITFAASFGSEQFATLFPSLQLDQESLYGFIRAQLLNIFLA